MPKLLVVDEDVFVGQMMKKAFTTEGFKVVWVTSSEDALACIKDIGFDVMVTELRLSGMDGWQLLQEVQNEPEIGRLPIVIISTVRGSQHRVAYLKAGAADFLEKPFQMEELVIRVKRIVDQAKAIQDGIQGFLDVYSIADLAQNFAQLKKDGWLEIYSQMEIGYLIFNQGQITRARFGSLRDREAFWSMHELKYGSFRFLPHRDVSTFAGDKPLNLNSILMRAAWVEDEFARVASAQAVPDQVMRRLKSPEELPAMEEGNLMARILRHFDHNAHHTLAHLHEAALASRQRTEFALAWLKFNGFLGAVPAQ